MSSAEQTGSTNGNDDAFQTPVVDTVPVAEQPASDQRFVYDPLAPDPVPPTSTTSGGAAGSDDDSTVGTGTSIALGCIVGTMVLIVFAILLLFIYSVIVN